MSQDLVVPHEEIIVFTDGACSGNPGPGGWGAIIVTPRGQVRELGGGVASTTNNQMELTAAIEALITLAREPGKLWLYTDSVYVIRGITEWIHGWRRRGWKTAEGAPVSNREHWEELGRLVQARGKDGAVVWKFVKGHSGIPGNERCDELAVGFTRTAAGSGPRPRLYAGSLASYPYPVLDLPPDVPVPEIKDRGGPKAAAHSYLSLVDGVAMRHATWPDCERRVKGRSGARFKKAMSEADERKILADWGVSL
jgi:ribonuclease HI